MEKTRDTGPFVGVLGLMLLGESRWPETRKKELKWDRNPVQALMEILEVRKQSKSGSGGEDEVGR